MPLRSVSCRHRRSRSCPTKQSLWRWNSRPVSFGCYAVAASSRARRPISLSRLSLECWPRRSRLAFTQSLSQRPRQRQRRHRHGPSYTARAAKAAKASPPASHPPGGPGAQVGPHADVEEQDGPHSDVAELTEEVDAPAAPPAARTNGETFDHEAEGRRQWIERM